MNVLMFNMVSRVYKFQMGISFNTKHPLYSYLEQLSDESNHFSKLTIGMLSNGNICMSLQILQNTSILNNIDDRCIIKKGYLELKNMIDSKKDNLKIYNLFKDLSMQTEFHQILCSKQMIGELYGGRNTLFLVNQIDLDQFNLTEFEKNTGEVIPFKKYILDEYSSHSVLLISNLTQMTVYDPDSNECDEKFLENVERYSRHCGFEFKYYKQINPIQSITNDTYCIFHSIIMIEHIMESKSGDIDQIIQLFKKLDHVDKSFETKDIVDLILKLEYRVLNSN